MKASFGSGVFGIIIHKVTKNLKFSSKHESIVNTEDQVITCDKHSTEVLLPEQQVNLESDENEEKDKHEEAITQKLMHNKATEHLRAQQHCVAGTSGVPE